MSIKCMTRVWEQTPKHIKGSQLLLLLAIADHARDDGHAWPGIGTLAEKIRMSERHTMRMLDELESDGVLYIDRRSYVNQYLVMVGLTDDEIAAALRDTFNLTPIEIHVILQDIHSPKEKPPKHGDNLSPCLEEKHGDILSNMVTSCQEDGDISDKHGDILSKQGDRYVTRTIRTMKNPEEEPSVEPLGRNPSSANSVRPSSAHVPNNHPAVVIYKATGIQNPQSAIRDVIGETVGKETPALAMWQHVVRWWMTSGGAGGNGKKNPRNVQAMLDVWNDAMTYLEADPDPEPAFAAWLAVREREGWSRPYAPPVEYSDTLPPAPVPISPEAALWEKAKAAARLQMTRATYEAHIQTTRCIGPNGAPDTWVIVTDNPYSVDWLGERLRPILESVASQVAGHPICLSFRAGAPGES